MLSMALLAAAESGINQVLRLDSVALPRLARLSGRVLRIQVPSPALDVFVQPYADGLHLASQYEGPVDCTLRAPISRLVELASRDDKNSVLHAADVELSGDATPLLALADLMADLQLDWEDRLSEWFGPLIAGLIGQSVRQSLRWSGGALHSFEQNLAEYLTEEARSLVGQREAEARFSELDQLRLQLDRLDARLARLDRLRQAKADTP